MNDAARYPANVFWSDEDEGFIATAPDLPGCSAFGEDRSEALSQLEDAIQAWIEAANAAGNPIPEPSRPGVEAQPSGKLLVRMPRSLHADLANASKRENVSLNHFVVFLLTTAMTSRTAARSVIPTLAGFSKTNYPAGTFVRSTFHRGTDSVAAALSNTAAFPDLGQRILGLTGGSEDKRPPQSSETRKLVFKVIE
jgi:antitoxin HicB